MTRVREHVEPNLGNRAELVLLYFTCAGQRTTKNREKKKSSMLTLQYPRVKRFKIALLGFFVDFRVPWLIMVDLSFQNMMIGRCSYARQMPKTSSFPRSISNELRAYRLLGILRSELPRFWLLNIYDLSTPSRLC